MSLVLLASSRSFVEGKGHLLASRANEGQSTHAPIDLMTLFLLNRRLHFCRSGPRGKAPLESVTLLSISNLGKDCPMLFSDRLSTFSYFLSGSRLKIPGRSRNFHAGLINFDYGPVKTPAVIFPLFSRGSSPFQLNSPLNDWPTRFVPTKPIVDLTNELFISHIGDKEANFAFKDRRPRNLYQ